jgi:hypothetical protein
LIQQREVGGGVTRYQHDVSLTVTASPARSPIARG